MNQPVPEPTYSILVHWKHTEGITRFSGIQLAMVQELLDGMDEGRCFAWNYNSDAYILDLSEVKFLVVNGYQHSQHPEDPAVISLFQSGNG
jgi:hypothetical protein